MITDTRTKRKKGYHGNLSTSKWYFTGEGLLVKRLTCNPDKYLFLDPNGGVSESDTVDPDETYTEVDIEILVKELE